LKAWFSGLDNVPNHPAQLHYAWLNNEDGTPNKISLNEGIRLATSTALELLQLRYDKPIRLLDAGCGVGGAVQQVDLFLQEQKVRGYEVHGISIVSEQLRLAKLRSIKLGALNSYFSVGDCLYLPYESSCFDGIIAIETFCHIPPESKQNLLQGLFRVLAPGGRMVILDAYLARKAESSDEKYWFNIFRNGWTLPEMVTVEEMNNIAKKSGFKIEKSFVGTERVRPSVKLIYRRGKYLLNPLLRIYKMFGKLGHESNLLKKTGVHTVNAEAFIQASFAQKKIVDRDLMTYYVHVLKRPPQTK
jgi:SAM-dependent methyltransferase